MILDLIVKNDDDGFTAFVPSLNGVEAWSADHDEAIDKVLDTILFYFNIAEKKEIKVDRARKEYNQIVYKLVLKI